MGYMTMYPISDDVNLSHLVKVVTASFLYRKVTVFPLVINKHLFGERYLETMQISCFSLSLHPLILASICGLACSNYCYGAVWGMSISLIPSMLIS